MAQGRCLTVEGMIQVASRDLFCPWTLLSHFHLPMTGEGMAGHLTISLLDSHLSLTAHAQIPDSACQLWEPDDQPSQNKSEFQMRGEGCGHVTLDIRSTPNIITSRQLNSASHQPGSHTPASHAVRQGTVTTSIDSHKICL